MLTARYLPTIGGAQVHVKNLAKEMLKRGNSVIIIAEKSPLKLKTHEYMEGVEVYRAPLRILKGLLSPIYLFLSITICFIFNPDVIHAHFAFPPGFIGTFLSKLFKKPCIVTAHGVDILKDAETNYGIRLNPFLDFAVKFTLKSASYIIACSEYVKNEVKKCGISEEKVIVINNGIDEIDRRVYQAEMMRQKVRKELNLPDDSIVLFTARRLVPKNGLHYLLHAIKKVSYKIPNIMLMVAGDGPQFRELTKMVEKMNLSKNVQFLGEINNCLLERMYIACDLVIIPSVVEAFGIAALEAMAYLKPIVAFDSGGLTEIISENKVGLIARNRDVKDLAEKILKLITSPMLKKEFTINCKRRIKKYNWDKIAEKTQNVYIWSINQFKRRQSSHIPSIKNY